MNVYIIIAGMALAALGYKLIDKNVSNTEASKVEAEKTKEKTSGIKRKKKIHTQQLKDEETKKDAEKTDELNNNGKTEIAETKGDEYVA